MYDIGLKNTIFDEKHHENMGMAIWLYAWFVDRVTKEKNGYGYVLGGTPICYAKLGGWIKERTYNRYTATLKKFLYIKVQKTSRGIIVLITKTKKRTARSGGAVPPEVAEHRSKVAELKDTTVDTTVKTAELADSKESALEETLFRSSKRT